MSDDVVIGKFGRPHGVRGEVRFFVYNPESELVTAGRTLKLVDGKLADVTVKSARQADKFLILQVEGFNSREDAERVRSKEASVARSELPAPADDEFYLHDVVGFEVWAPRTSGGEAELLGTVKGWLDIGPRDIMAVTGPNIKGRMLVPHIDHVVDTIDFETNQVRLHPMDLWAPDDE